jgi:hypothetical protein
MVGPRSQARVANGSNKWASSNALASLWRSRLVGGGVIVSEGVSADEDQLPQCYTLLSRLCGCPTGPQPAKAPSNSGNGTVAKPIAASPTPYGITSVSACNSAPQE